MGEDGFKKAPVGAGPYRFVSFTPGVELVAGGVRGLLAQGAEREAARLQGRCPTTSTRLAMLKRGEADIAYSLRGPLAEEVGGRRA